MEWPTNLDEYEKLVIRMNTPRVAIDNAVCSTATLVKVDSASSQHDVLLESIQVLADLDLSIQKAYISSDGRWFMDVFHVTDQFGRKLADQNIISYLEQSLDTANPEGRRSQAIEQLTALELVGPDRPGLLSEIFAVLADLQCAVAAATVWTHRGRFACILSVHDELSGAPIADPQQTQRVESRLRQILRCGKAAVTSSAAVAHPDRRLHQLMLADRDYERPTLATATTPSVSVQNWAERGYSVVSVQCVDRTKLLFDVLCTLTDMDYVVFHGTVDTDGDLAHLELYFRHKDGNPISSEAERQRVIQCLQASMERRASKATRLELHTDDRPGLHSDVTRAFRENGLLVTKAEVSTKGHVASSVFHVTGAAGQPADPKAIEAVQQRIGLSCLQVKEEQRPRYRRKAASGGVEEALGSVGIALLYLSSLVRRNLYNLGLIKSFS